MVIKEGEKFENKISFNFSPTSINTYYQSPLLFYLTYIAKVPDDTQVPVCYGLSGNIIHSCLERYAKKELDRDNIYIYFSEQWKKQSLNLYKDIKNEILNQEEYLIALIKGLDIIDSYEEHICEETIKFNFIENEIMKIGIKGIVDLQAKQKSDSEKVIIDYKTSNSVNQSKDFERQALFYNYLIHKKGEPLPKKTIFQYLKLGIEKIYAFTQEDIEAFEEELKAIAEEILEYGTDISKYPIGKIEDIFNSKKEACIREVIRRNGYHNPRTFVEMRY